MRRCLLSTYETLYITAPNLAEDDERATVDHMTGIVTNGGGTLLANDRMGRRRLAYPIQKFDDGVYVRLLYDSESAVPIELERRGRLSDKVLRTLTVKLERDWAEHAKQQAVDDARRREEAAVAEAAAAEAAAAAAAAAPPPAADEAQAPEAAEAAAAAPPPVADEAQAPEAAAAQAETPEAVNEGEASAEGADGAEKTSEAGAGEGDREA